QPGSGVGAQVSGADGDSVVVAIGNAVVVVLGALIGVLDDVVGVAGCVELPVGAVIAAVGGVVSVEAVAATRPDCSVAGCTPMSARRLTVACCMLGSVGGPAKSCWSSRPQGHWMVPAEKTSAPLVCL